MILNGHDSSDIINGDYKYYPSKKAIRKLGEWVIIKTPSYFVIPCKITHETKEELVAKLNDVETWLRDGWLYIGDNKYQVQVVESFKADTDYSGFNVTLQSDEFEYEYYPYIKMSEFKNTRNPLQMYNFTGQLNLNPFSQTIEFNPKVDNIVTVNFACVDGIIYGSHIPLGYNEDGDEITRVHDISI